MLLDIYVSQQGSETEKAGRVLIEKNIDFFESKSLKYSLRVFFIISISIFY